jgi:O-antigen/teichoic acid export membrane protein
MQIRLSLPSKNTLVPKINKHIKALESGYIYWLKKLKNPKVAFIIINLLISGLSFLRVFICMRYLNYYDLGLTGLIQILVMVITMLQLGVITGGYKIYSISTAGNEENNTVFSYITVLGAIAIPVSIVWGQISRNLDTGILILGIAIGVMGLFVSWFTCMMLARNEIRELNRINLLSAGITFLLLPTIIFWKVEGAFLNTAAYPLIFCILALRKKELRPTSFLITSKQIRKLLHYGFIPYLTSAFFYLNTQIERWSIVDILGVEALGKLTLCVVTTAGFMIIPSSLSSLHFPDAMKFYAEKNFPAFKKVMRAYTLSLIGYCVLFALATFILSDKLILLFFPKHVEQITLIYWLIPALILNAISNITTIIFTAAFKYRAIVLANVTATLTMVLGITLIIQLKSADLQSFVMIESAVGLCTLAANGFIYLKVKNKLYV